MDTQPTIYVLSDAELDAVTGGKKGGGGGGGGGTVVDIVEISIGEIVAAANSTIVLDVINGGSHNSSKSSGNKRH